MSVYKRGIGDQGISHFPKKFVTLYASAACTAGSWVMLTTDDTNGLGGSCADSNVTGQNEGLIFGIATQTVAAGEDVVVQVAGKYEDANVATSVTQGDRLLATSTSGRVAEATTIDPTSVAAALDYTICGVALEDEPGGGGTNTADVMIINQGYF
tara:strand:- start:26933 stop:27397 length:465 start_codon:yes stop_codon:yes gene_type:complete